jgi:hypothetical protein
MGRVLVSASRRAETVSRATVRIGAALVLSILAQTSANAGNASDPSCAGRWTGFNCAALSGEANNPYIRLVPEPLGDNERAQFAQRDRRWVDHCHPVVQYDRYGVARYRYTATGCEFGLGAAE